ncbi:MAG: MarR family transcriptional regulator [Chloroflexi bacterium]|nr:MarR family transcriptional regulator [Chloroflexota bacterium]
MPTDKQVQERARQQGLQPKNDATRHLCFKLGKVVRRVYNLYHQPLAVFGLTPSQLFVFSALWMEDGINFSDLANRVAIDVSTLTGIIDRMEKVGFVERRPDPKDRRAVRLFLTEKGLDTGPAILKLADDLDSVMRRQFPKADMETFERVLRALGEAED